MLVSTRNRSLERSILALDHAFEESYYDHNITPEISLKNIRDNIIKIHLAKPKNGEKEHHYSKYGLLLTTDGFILTSYSHFPDVTKDWRRKVPGFFGELGNYFFYRKHVVADYHVKLKNGGIYPLDVTVCFAIPEFDIAVVKAFIDADPKPIKFKVETKEPDIGDKVMILCSEHENINPETMKELGPLYKKAQKKLGQHSQCDYEGLVMRDKGVSIEDIDHKNTVKGVFTLQTKYHHQHGGEPIITPKGKLLGMTLGACTNHSGGQFTRELFSAKIKRMQKAVDLARESLKKECLGWS